MIRENAMTEDYEKVTVLDKPMLYTPSRIDRSTLPEGMYLYEVRHNDDLRGDPVEIADSIRVNYWGALISNEPLPLQPDETSHNNYMLIDPEEDWNYEGSDMTLEEYMEQHPPKGVAQNLPTFEVSAATPEERLYCGRQSGQIAGQMGWTPSDYQNEDFQAALKTVDAWENGLDVADFCAEHSEAKEQDGTYTFRANVGDYTFMISLFPQKSPEHQTDTWCYETRWLDRHMENARDGIRFLDADNGYKTMFRVRDGSKIRRTIRDGAFLDNTDETCRYIDAAHMELGGRLYHIDQFAELCRDAWIEVSAVREEDKIPVGRIDVLKPDGKEIEESQRYTNVDDLLRGIEDCDRAGKHCTVVAYRDRHDNLQYREDRPDVRIPLEKYDPERIHFVQERMPAPAFEPEKTASEEEPVTDDATTPQAEETVETEEPEIQEDISDGRKYELLDTQKGFKPYRKSLGACCSRIRALRDFDGPYGTRILKGTLGGYVESEKNLSQTDSAWIYDNAVVCEDAQVLGNACVANDAVVCGNARIENADIDSHAMVMDHAVVRNGARITDEAQISGCATVDGAEVADEAIVCSNAYIGRNACVAGRSYVEDATVQNYATVVDSRLSQGVAVEPYKAVVSEITDRGKLIPYTFTDASLPFDYPEWKAWEIANNRAAQQQNAGSPAPERCPEQYSEGSAMEYDDEEDDLEV